MEKKRFIAGAIITSLVGGVVAAACSSPGEYVSPLEAAGLITPEGAQNSPDQPATPPPGGTPVPGAEDPTLQYAEQSNDRLQELQKIAGITPVEDPAGYDRPCAGITEVRWATNQGGDILAEYLDLQDGRQGNSGEIVIYQDGVEVGRYKPTESMAPLRPSTVGLSACETR
jgi:hypothetical protein